MRFVVAKRIGRRGAGLGNEILPWAKGWIASQVLDARLVGPSWGINQRRYYRNFRTSRLDFLLEDGLQHLPHSEFTEADYLECGEIDFGVAIKRWAAAKGLTRESSYIVVIEGMWGGYPAIRSARDFLKMQLLNSRDTLRNVFEITSRLDRRKLFVAVHMRSIALGFTAPELGENLRGKFNILIPGEWYLSVCSKLQRRFGDRIQFRIFTDRPGPDFKEMVRRFNPGQISQTGFTECSDLIAMAQADLRICSISSYSLAANFLSEGPYIWYEPQLTLEDGHYSLWGRNESNPLVRRNASMDETGFGSVATCVDTGTASRTALGVAMNAGDLLPESLAELLEQKLSSRAPESNLLDFGSIPQS